MKENMENETKTVQCTAFINKPDAEQIRTETLHILERNKMNKMRLFLIMVALCLALLSSFSSIYILSSYFPKEGQDKGVSGIEIGAISGMPQFVFILVIFFEIFLMNKVLPKSQIVIGLIITGSTVALFGFLDRIHNSTWFVVTGIALRAIQGIGIVAIDLCVFILTSKSIPPAYLSTAIGTLECVIGIAVSVALPLGGYLYEVQGFYFPFLISGILCFLSAIICFISLPNSAQEQTYSLKIIFHYAKKFEMLVFIYHFAIGGLLLGFFGGMIEPHLREFNLSPFHVGLVILVANGIPIFAFPIWGLICDKVIRPSLVAEIGYILVIIGLILFGPFPFLTMKLTIGISVLSLIICGLGIAAFMISAYSQANNFLKEICPSQDTVDMVNSTAYISVANLWSCFGMLIGGSFVDYLGYRNGSALLVALNIIGMILQFAVIRRQRAITSNTEFRS